jgi:hypothetical protein
MDGPDIKLQNSGLQYSIVAGFKSDLLYVYRKPLSSTAVILVLQNMLRWTIMKRI